jgi:hypothetical protein
MKYLALSSLALVLIFAAMVSLPVSSKAAYATRLQMVNRADSVAVVNIGPVTDCKITGRHWTYAQTAQANVEQTLKGSLPVTIRLVGQENFECAQTKLKTGRCLVFLGRVEAAGSSGEPLYAGCNWQASLCPVLDNGKLHWLLEPSSCFATDQVPLDTALKQIRQDLATR